MPKVKILIIRFSSIGDIVLTTPVIRCLKKQIPHAEIHYCTKAQYKSIFEENPYIDQMHYLTEDLGSLIRSLKKENFSCVIDLHKNLRTLMIKTRLGVQSHSFNKLNWEKWLLVNLKVNRMPNVHIVDRYMETVKPLGVTNDNKGLDYFIPEKDVVEKEWLPATHHNGYMAFAIGGQHTTKKLPFEKIIELCDRIARPIILLGGKEDQEMGQKVEEFFQKREHNLPFEEGLKQLGKKTIIFDGCGKFSLNQSASIVRDAQAVFTHDTGLMHIAAAFNKKIFSIWGNTTPLFGMYPYTQNFVIFENAKLSCRPCSKIGYDKCPKGHFKCMNELQFDFYLPED
ncbi:glycosyltransferase family 9 protein [Rapidithrix thailandica]|uniref:Glycosyltransferase family 9 protein n=2 Tax=Rapidithrix thailandica TaxID=413964 RepID=A0AAW9SCY8_9BACT